MTEGNSGEEEELQIMIAKSVEIEATKVGDIFCLLSKRWWNKWTNYVLPDKTVNTNESSSSDHQDLGSSSTRKRPPSIDNSDLINELAPQSSTMGIELHDTLQENSHYILVPEVSWNQFYAWYGGGPKLARKVINVGESQTELTVEVYPLRIRLHLMPVADQCTIRISKRETIGALHKKACEIFQLNSEQVTIWDYFSHQKHGLMNDLDKMLEDANIQTDQDILVEVSDNIGGCTSDAQENGFTKNDTPLVEPSKTSHSNADGLSSSKDIPGNNNSDLSQLQSLTFAIRESED